MKENTKDTNLEKHVTEQMIKKTILFYYLQLWFVSDLIQRHTFVEEDFLTTTGQADIKLVVNIHGSPDTSGQTFSTGTVMLYS